MIRKIIHIDMDCFFAAVEIRDNPSLQNQPVAIGGRPEERGVLATCNYVARRYGLHSAMSTARAFQRCPALVLLPVNMEKYRAVSKHIHAIFKVYTDLIEPLSLDEAFLDVSDSTHFSGSATLIAQAIQKRIWDEAHLTASAGVSVNKLLAKIASDWRKPNGLFVIPPEAVADFIAPLDIEKLYGVGKVTAQKMHMLSVHTCADLQALSLSDLQTHFGKMGERYYHFCRGEDDRPVEVERKRHRVSVEITFPSDLISDAQIREAIKSLFARLEKRLQSHTDRHIHKQFVKLKFSDFHQTTAECISEQCCFETFTHLLSTARMRHTLPIRLIGMGVGFVMQ